MSNKWLIIDNLDKVEAQCKSKYVESDYASLYRYDWRVNEKNEDLTLFLPAYVESACIKGYLSAITDFRLMLEGVNIDVSEILDE